MAITVARLMAEVGIDPRNFKAGLKSVKDDITQTAKEIVDLQKLSVKLADEQVRANDRIIASNKKHQDSLLAIAKAEEALVIAQRNAQNAANTLASTQTRASDRRTLAGASPDPAQRALFGAQADALERQAENAQRRYQTAVDRVAQAERALSIARQNSVRALEQEQAATIALNEAQAMATIEAENLSKAETLLAQKAIIAKDALLAQEKVILESQMEAYGTSLQKTWSGAFDTIGHKAKQIGQSMTMAFTVPTAIIGDLAFKAEKDFEFSMDKIHGLTVASAEDINRWEAAILEMGPEVGKMPKALAEGMYFVASAGYKGAEALDILNESAKGSEEGLGETAKITHALTSILFDYRDSIHTASEAMDILTAGSREGKLSVDQLAPSLGRIMPLTASLGISINDVVAAIDSMTHAGISVDRAATSVQTFFTKLAAGGKEVNKVLGVVGTNSQKVLQSMQTDFLGTLTRLDAELRKHGLSLINLVGSQRQVAGMLSLVGENTEYNRGIFERMNNTLGTSTKAWSAVANSSKVAVDQMSASINVAEISLGEALAPAIIAVSHGVITLSKNFTDLPQPVKEVIGVVALLVATAGPLIYITGALITSVGTITKLFGAMAVVSGTATEAIASLGGAAVVAEGGTAGLAAAFAALSGPVGWTILGIAAVSAAIYGLVKAYDAYMDVGQKSTKEINDAYITETKKISSTLAHNKEVLKLITQYDELNSKVKMSADDQKRLEEIYDKIAALNPELVKGYTAMGDRIGFATKAMLDFKTAIEGTNSALQNQLRIRAVMDKTADDLNSLRTRKLDTEEQIRNLIANGVKVIPGQGSSSTPPAGAERHYGINHTAWDTFRAGTPQFDQEMGRLNVVLSQLTKQLTDADKAQKKMFEASKGLTDKIKPPIPPGGTVGDKFKVDAHVADQAAEIIKAIGEGVRTPKGVAACAYFASQVMGQAGLAVPKMGGAKALRDYVSAHGTQVDMAHASPLDLVAWQGSQYGAIQNGKRSGYHVGVYLGGGQVMTDSHKRGQKMFDQQNASFYHMQGDTALGISTAGINNEAYKAQLSILGDLAAKNIDLQKAMGLVNDMTGAQTLALEYHYSNLKLDKDQVTESVLGLQRYNLQLQRMVDLHEIYEKSRAKTKSQKDEIWMSGLSKSKQEMVSAFGVDDWRKLSAMKDPKAGKLQADFANNFYTAADEARIRVAKEDFRDLSDQIEGVINKNQGDKSETSKALIKISAALRDIHDKSKLKEIQPMIDKILHRAGIADAIREWDNFVKVFSELDKVAKQNRSINNGSASEKSLAFMDWFQSNKEDLFKLFENFGMDAVGSAMDQWGKNFDSTKVTQGLIDFNSQLNQARIQAKILADTDPYQKWYDSQTKIDSLGGIQKPNFGGQDPHQIFDTIRQNQAIEKMLELKQETARAAAEINAKDPFEAWLVSIEEYNQLTGKLQLPPGFDRELLKIQFDLQKNEEMIREFAAGIKDIFGQMITDIRDHGFKDLFKNIEQGFEQLLFKMAVEYLESYLYQLLLSSMGSLFSLAGASGGGGSNMSMVQGNTTYAAIGGAAYAGMPMVIGEHGKEVFVPGMDGYIVPNHALSGPGETLMQYSGTAGSTGSWNTSNSNTRNSTTNSASEVHIHNHNTIIVQSVQQAKQVQNHLNTVAVKQAERAKNRLS